MFPDNVIRIISVLYLLGFFWNGYYPSSFFDRNTIIFVFLFLFVRFKKVLQNHFIDRFR